ncbi:hypothetical protein NE237_026674 [Protea cynaroides]|uniref:Uncharacterized protein n=1 Tax=Protea cynaroides TaxID=273540 RepID=A0A9Q0H4P7_9MAGN|nr:hypothetical protein NE237_026674 [Protea cynaroides]
MEMRSRVNELSFHESVHSDLVVFPYNIVVAYPSSDFGFHASGFSYDLGKLEQKGEMERLSSTIILPEAFQGTRDDNTRHFGIIWDQIKAPLIVPLLRLAVILCLIMSVMLFIERVYMAIVYQLSIGAACGLSWLTDRIIIPVPNDSIDKTIKDLVQHECQRWGRKEINIKYEVRDNRNGYKGGALKEGMKRNFQPEPDFLWRTVHFLALKTTFFGFIVVANLYQHGANASPCSYSTREIFRFTYVQVQE